MDGWLQDLRYSFRALARSPGFTLTAVLVLALAIGANTVIFVVLDTVVLESLPYRKAERLVVLWVDFGEGGQSLPAISSLDLRDVEEWSTRFDGFAAGSGATASLTGVGDPELVDLGRVSFDLFPLLGVEPRLGRQFHAEEDVADGPAVVLLGHGLWQRRFASDPAVLGRTIEIDGIAHEVIGVLPADFELLLPADAMIGHADLWVPLQDRYAGPRNRTMLTAVGRLRDGVTRAQAQEEMDAIAERLRADHLVHSQADTRIRLVPLREDLVKDVRPALELLLAAVALVLLIACGNVASLLLARATVREREVAIRASLGAGRFRIARQILMESSLVAVVAGAVGLLLASWGIELLFWLGPPDLPRLREIGIDPSAAGFTLALSLFVGLLFGIAPAFQVSRSRGLGALRESSRIASGGESLRRVFVAGEVALSLVLLVGVVLLLRSFVLLLDARPGFETDGVLTFRLSLPAQRYASAETRIDVYDRALAELGALPGVSSVAVASQLPLSGLQSQMPYAYDDETAQNWEIVTADEKTVSEDYFTTARTRLLAGRPFDRRDRAGAELVVIVDELLAAKAWPDRDAVGQRLMLPVFGPDGIRREWHEVVGVVEHARLHDPARAGREQAYLPLRQSGNRNVHVLVRTEGDPGELAGLVRRAVQALDPDLPLHRLQPWSDYVTQSMSRRRFTLWLGLFFGGVSLLLASVALYGLTSYTVSCRTRELGIRVALGASRAGVFRLVLLHGVWLALVGLGFGVPAALLASRTLSGMLYGVSASDPLTFAAVSLLLAAVAMLACWLPARRATRVDPTVALRCD